MSTEKLSTLSFRKQWRVLLEYRSYISLSYPKSWVSILGGDNLLCVEEDNIYPIQCTNNHFNSTTIVCIWTKTALYDYFFFKKEDKQLESAPTQDKFFDFDKIEFWDKKYDSEDAIKSYKSIPFENKLCTFLFSKDVQNYVFLNLFV